MTNDELSAWAFGALDLVACGASHEIERDEGLAALTEMVEESELDGPDSLLIRAGGRALRITLLVEEIAWPAG